MLSACAQQTEKLALDSWRCATTAATALAGAFDAGKVLSVAGVPTCLRSAYAHPAAVVVNSHEAVAVELGICR